MTFRSIYILLLCLLLLTCDHGDAAKDLKEKYSSANFHKNCDEPEEKTSSKSSYITRLKGKYQSSSVAAVEADEKIARLESKYELGYNGAYAVDEPNENIALLESKYELGYGGAHVVDETKEKIARLESKYDLGYNGAYGAYEPNERIARLESKYELGYNGAYAADEPNQKIALLENKYEVEEVEGTSSIPSSQGAEHHIMEHDHRHDDDIGSEDVGVFTIDDVRAFDVGRKLSTFFSIRNRSLYPGLLPREVADSIPFSSTDIPKILQFFSVSPESPKGKAVRKTISTCEIKPAKGENKICATSSESMLEFLKTAFGEADIKFISTSNPTMTAPIIQSYTVLEPPREIESPRKVACHPLPYLYGIYMCHYDGTETKVFKVPLVGDSGDKVDALIVCHMNTSAWGPKHVAFSLLGTKPGAPVCHSFSEGHGVWIQSSTRKVAAM